MDPKMMQMMAMMGGGAGAGNYAEMSMMPQTAMPRLNPERMMDNMVQRQAIRQGMYGPGTRPRGGALARMYSGAGAGMPGIGGGMDPSSMTDPSVANDALSPYGLQMPTHTNPFLFFNDQNKDGSPTWAGNHPKVAKAIEGAMIGATTPGGQTIGENISNVAKTVLGIPGMYRNSQAAQMQAPFDQAKMIGALQDDQINREYKLAEVFHLRATGQAALDKPAKSYSGALYTSPSTNQVSGYNTVTNTLEPVNGQPASDLTKIGGPHASGSPSVYPKGVSTTAEKNVWTNYVQNAQKNGQTAPTSPLDVPNWDARVRNESGALAKQTGAGGAGGRLAGGGGVAKTDQDRLDSLKNDATAAEAFAGKKLSPSDFGKESDPLAALQAERSRRQADAVAKRKAYNDATTQISGSNPNGKLNNGQNGGRPKIKIGNITIE